jgi:TolB protein
MSPRPSPTFVVVPLTAVLGCFAAPLAEAQWANRYQKIDGYSHHVYFEGFEMPTMNQGPTSPAPSPDGSQVAFSARGWLWVLDLSTRVATRITDGAAMDFRPSWSPDGTHLAFVRDDTRDTWIVVRDLASGEEATVNTPAIELDPVFTADGAAVIYSSAAEGALDLWQHDLAAGASTRLSDLGGIELKPTLSADGGTLVYVHKGSDRGPQLRPPELDRVVARDVRSGEEQSLAFERIVSQLRPAVAPNGQTVVYPWATQDGYELRLVWVTNPTTSVLLTTGHRGLPLSPAWDPGGDWIWFVEADADEVMQLYRIRAAGGSPEHVAIDAWDWGTATGTLRIRTVAAGTPVPARLDVGDGRGHPLMPTVGQVTFGLQDGRHFFYTAGVVELTVPAGEVSVSAVRGLTTPEVRQSVTVAPGATHDVELALEEVWDARAAGYLSGDHHFHLNYGGIYTLEPDDLLPMMAGENLDVGTPLVANLHNRFEYQSMFGWQRDGELPLIQFGQEVRSHFLGHLGLLNTETLFWPWIWGPGYQVYSTDDRPNAEPLAHARAEGGLAGYVHPAGEDPFGPGRVGRLPVLLAVDGVLGNMDWLEVACLWTDELGSSDVWYRFLNLGVPIALEAGTDVMNDYYRTMAVGTTRLYVQTGGATTLDAYWRGMREGRSFVTTGPMLQLAVDGAAPGDAVDGGRTVGYRIQLATAVPVDRVELLVNGEVVRSDGGLGEPGQRAYRGRIAVPEGGWVAARAVGGAAGWPAMDSYAFAHTSPVWLGHVGSTDPAARARAAEDLGEAIDAAEQRLLATYGGEANVPRILAVIEQARERLRNADAGGTP